MRTTARRGAVLRRFLASPPEPLLVSGEGLLGSGETAILPIYRAGLGA